MIGSIISAAIQSSVTIFLCLENVFILVVLDNFDLNIIYSLMDQDKCFLFCLVYDIFNGI